MCLGGVRLRGTSLCPDRAGRGGLRDAVRHGAGQDAARARPALDLGAVPAALRRRRGPRRTSHGPPRRRGAAGGGHRQAQPRSRPRQLRAPVRGPGPRDRGARLPRRPGRRRPPHRSRHRSLLLSRGDPASLRALVPLGGRGDRPHPPRVRRAREGRRHRGQGRRQEPGRPRRPAGHGRRPHRLPQRRRPRGGRPALGPLLGRHAAQDLRRAERDPAGLQRHGRRRPLDAGDAGPGLAGPARHGGRAVLRAGHRRLLPRPPWPGLGGGLRVPGHDRGRPLRRRLRQRLLERHRDGVRRRRRIHRPRVLGRARRGGPRAHPRADPVHVQPHLPGRARRAQRELLGHPGHGHGVLGRPERPRSLGHPRLVHRRGHLPALARRLPQHV